jgi:hypothetical protein
MKTLLKNRRSYHHRIGLPDICNSKDINGEKSDADSDDMYMKEKGDENGRDGNGSKDGNGSEDGNGNSGEGVDEDGNGYGDVDEEEFGAKDDEGRNGEGSSSAKQAGKRKATQDNEPATATRPKKKVNQVATQSTTKAALKRK